MDGELVHIRVWGDFACFTRPEMKVERVSYPLVTPSAARGILEAIFWKPEMYYVIDSVRVIKKGKWTSIRRNEVTKQISLTKAKSAMQGNGEVPLIAAGGGAADATQRNMLALQDVEYIISAKIALSKIGKAASQTINKYQAELARRVKSGKCFHRPSFGVREFSCEFALVEDSAEIPETVDWNEDLGLMLFDLFDVEERSHGFAFTENGKTIGKLSNPAASFFIARVENGLLDCNPERIAIHKAFGGER
ncbi:MAG: type I-C CRISPR-associated protein Cas5c [Pyrinomonadaceae bacterium]